MTSSATFEKAAWQRRPITQVIAVAVVCVPPYALAIFFQLSQRTITLKELFLYPLLVGGGSVVLALLAYRFICGERIASLNMKLGKWYTDVFVGIVLAAFFLGLFVLQQVIQSRWLPRTAGPPPEELMTLFNGIVNDPLLLAVWIGPVAWLGVATFEELTRVFMLNRLWTVWSQPLGRWIVMIVSAALFGLVHLYQGPVSAVAIALQGLLYAWYYKRFGRIWPMIVGHALYDSVQVIQVVMAFRGR
jgi:membrane protease YdiL (CAAX protease family)